MMMKYRVRYRGMMDYIPCYDDMVEFSLSAVDTTPDELWVLQHPPVYTMGLNGKQEHLLNVGDITVVNTDRGGQVTYHGPGQLVIYCLLNMRQHHYGVRDLVRRLENSIMELLTGYGIDAELQPGAPGVYIDGRKIAALGIRVKRGRSWHGIALNVDMDLAPFSGINPCGYDGLEVTQLRDLGIDNNVDEVAADLIPLLAGYLELGELQFQGDKVVSSNYQPQI